MTSRIAVIVIDANDPQRVAEFWTAALGWQVGETDEGIISIGPRDGTSPTIDIVAVPETKTIKNRLHLDVRAKDSSTADEIARLEGLGARRVDVGQPADATWTVLADPEGNEFCVLSRTVAEAADR